MKKNILIALLFGSCFMLQAQTGIGTPSPDPSAVLELKSTTRGFLPPRMTTNQRNVIVSPATGLMIYNSDKKCLEWYNGTVWYNGCGSQDSSGGTAVVSGYMNANISTGTMTAGTAVTGVTQTITATVTAVGSYAIAFIANGIIFTGSGTFTGTGAQNIVLIATGTPVVAETSNFVLNTTPNCTFNRIVLAAPVGLVGGNAICDGSVPTKVVPITSATTKIWMDRNLGASRAATSYDDYQAYGCLYQWGRGNDGHASMTWTSATTGTAVNGTTKTLAVTDSPGNALFIEIGDAMSNDWRSSTNDALWQGKDGINNPCPAGYRVPTDAELTAEVTSYSITNPATAYASLHKFVVAGFRDYSDGFLNDIGTYGSYWSSTVSGRNASSFDISSGGANSYSSDRAYGGSVRCIKD
jgi:uncharacterized protein (TIGR02145 family)